VFTRQGVPHQERTNEQIANIKRGGYVLKDTKGTPDAIVIATGSEVGLAMDAAEALEKEGIFARVVSMPSTDRFEAQDAEYRNSVLPPEVTARVAVEAAMPDLWHKYVGLDGVVVGQTTFGESAPGNVLFLALLRKTSAKRSKPPSPIPRRNNMALISLRQLLDYAAENDFGMPAFNVNNMEQIHAIMKAADEVNSPVILQGSAGARKYAGPAFIRGLVHAAAEQWPHIPIVLHQDHGASPAVCQRSIQSGFTSVMMDGSLMTDMKTPSSYEYNVDVTKKVVDMAHACGVSVEGELGCLGSLETGLAGEEDGSGAEGVLTPAHRRYSGH